MAYQGMPVISAPVTPRDLHSGSLSQSAYTSGHTPHAGSQTARLPASAARADQLRREQVMLIWWFYLVVIGCRGAGDNRAIGQPNRF